MPALQRLVMPDTVVKGICLSLADMEVSGLKDD